MFNFRSVKHSNVLSSLFREKKKMGADKYCNTTTKNSKIISLADESQISEDLGEDTARNRLCAPLQETQKLLKMKRKRLKHVRKKKTRKSLSVRSHLKYDTGGQAAFSKNSPSKRNKSFNQYSRLHDLASISLFPDPCKDICSLKFTRIVNQSAKEHTEYLSPSSSEDDEHGDSNDRGISLSSRLSSMKRQRKKRFHSLKLKKAQKEPCSPLISYSSSSSLEEQEYMSKKTISVPSCYMFPSDCDQHKVSCPAYCEAQSIEESTITLNNEISFLTEKVSTARNINHRSDDNHASSSTQKLEELRCLKGDSDFTQISSKRKDDNITPTFRESASKCSDDEITVETHTPDLNKQTPLLPLPSIDEVVAPGPLFDAYNFDYSELEEEENIPHNHEIDPENQKCIFDHDCKKISKSDDDFSVHHQIDPRMTILPSDNDLKSYSEQRSHFHKWTSNIDECVIVQQTNNVDPEIFGYSPVQTENQQLLLIPWTHIKKFKYKCNTNPCSEIFQDNK